MASRDELVYSRGICLGEMVVSLDACPRCHRWIPRASKHLHDLHSHGCSFYEFSTRDVVRREYLQQDYIMTTQGSVPQSLFGLGKGCARNCRGTCTTSRAYRWRRWEYQETAEQSVNSTMVLDTVQVCARSSISVGPTCSAMIPFIYMLGTLERHQMLTTTRLHQLIGPWRSCTSIPTPG